MRPATGGSPVSSVSAAAAMSLGVSRLPAGTAATICGSGSPPTSIALQSNKRQSLAQAVSAISASVLNDSSRPAKPAMVALRAAWLRRLPAWLRIRGRELAGDEGDDQQHDTVTTSVSAVHAEGVNRGREEEIVGQRGSDRRRRRPGPGPTAPRQPARRANRSCRPAQSPSAAQSRGRPGSRRRPSRSPRHKPGCGHHRSMCGGVDFIHGGKWARAGRASRPAPFHGYQLVMRIHMESLCAQAPHIAGMNDISADNLLAPPNVAETITARMKRCPS